jgi:hypothetical protein
MTVPDSGMPPVDAGPKTIAERTFGEFEAWASPIDDYLAIGKKFQPNKFNASINDLAPMGDRMFIGYGDADYNLGEKIPIEFRFFASPDDPTHASSIVDGAGQGAPQMTPQQSGEEQIDRYRLLDGALWQAGIDSIDADELATQAATMPKAIDGNMYRLEGDVWRKFRSVRGGEHVHDVMNWKGSVYSVGSGADLRTEFEAGQIFRYLWRTTDLGKTFSTVQRVMHPDPGKGDIRWITLVPSPNALYLFGYQSDFATNTAKISNSSFDGQTVTDLPMGHALHDIYATNSLPLPDGSAILTGIDVGPSVFTTRLLRTDGTLEKLFEGSRTLDAFLAGDEIVYLTALGDDPKAKPTSFEVHIFAAKATSPADAKEIMTFTTDVRPTSIAFWKDHLFLGTGNGRVFRTS